MGIGGDAMERGRGGGVEVGVGARHRPPRGSQDWGGPRTEGSPAPPQVHAHILSRLKKEMPAVFGKGHKKKQLIAQLPLLFARIQMEQHIPPGDFPDCARMQVCCRTTRGRDPNPTPIPLPP